MTRLILRSPKSTSIPGLKRNQMRFRLGRDMVFPIHLSKFTATMSHRPVSACYSTIPRVLNSPMKIFQAISARFTLHLAHSIMPDPFRGFFSQQSIKTGSRLVPTASIMGQVSVYSRSACIDAHLLQPYDQSFRNFHVDARRTTKTHMLYRGHYLVCVSKPGPL